MMGIDDRHDSGTKFQEFDHKMPDGTKSTVKGFEIQCCIFSQTEDGSMYTFKRRVFVENGDLVSQVEMIDKDGNVIDFDEMQPDHITKLIDEYIYWSRTAEDFASNLAARKTEGES